MSRYLYTASGVALAQVFICGSSTGASTATTATYYYPMAGYQSTLQPQTTEANIQVICRAAGTLANLYWRVNANARADTNQNIKSRIATANGNMTISSIASTTGTASDTTNTDSVSSGQTINYSLTLGSSAANFNVTMLGSWFTSSGPAFQGCGQINAGVASGYNYNFNTTSYPGFSANNNVAADTTESNVQFKSGIIFTGSRMQATIQANGVNGSSTWLFRLNAGSGNQTVTIASTTTGTNEDSTHTDSVVATDELNYRLVTGGSSGSMNVTGIGMMVTVPSTGGLFGLSFLDGLSTSGPTQFTRVA
jgi:hypothetical protein